MSSRRPKPLPLDRWVVKRGWAKNREDARALISTGQVLIDGLPITNPSSQVRPDRPVRLQSAEKSWVGRGAHKLLGALLDLPMAVKDHVCADLGSSTGGFTEVLLHHGAQHIFAIDVGRGLLHRSLEVHPDVTVLEGTNARTLRSLPQPVSRIVGDLSFISLKKMLPTVQRLLVPGGEALLLIKPQFEAPRSAILPGGTLSSEDRTAAINEVLNAIAQAGFIQVGQAPSRLPGAKSKNLEQFVWLRTHPTT